VERGGSFLRQARLQRARVHVYDDINYPGGIETTQGGTINNWPPTAELASFGAIPAQAEYDVWHAHPTFDMFWQERALLGRYASIQVPVLTVGGWIDENFRSGTLTNIEGALERTWAIYGQWKHSPPVDVGACDQACVEDPLPSGVLLAWFDHWLLELKQAPIPAQPTFVSFEGPKAASHGWRELSAWLPEGSAALSFELGSDGTLAATASATAPMIIHEPGEASAAGAALTFTTAALDKDHVLIGHPSLDLLHVKLSAPDASFYVELLDVDSADKETLVNDGFLKASHRTSHTSPTPVALAEATDFHIAVRPQHYRFASGHRLRMRLWGGAKDALVQPAPVDVTIETGSSAKLTMPNFAAEP
jgi:predicted acyl esterase